MASHGKTNPCFSLPCPFPSREEDLLAGGKCLIAALANSRLSPACRRCACAGEQRLQDEPGSASASPGRASLGRWTCTLREPSGLAPMPAPEQGDKGCSGLLRKRLSHPIPWRAKALCQHPRYHSCTKGVLFPFLFPILSKMF